MHMVGTLPVGFLVCCVTQTDCYIYGLLTLFSFVSTILRQAEAMQSQAPGGTYIMPMPHAPQA